MWPPQSLLLWMKEAEDSYPSTYLVSQPYSSSSLKHLRNWPNLVLYKATKESFLTSTACVCLGESYFTMPLYKTSLPCCCCSKCNKKKHYIAKRMPSCGRIVRWPPSENCFLDTWILFFFQFLRWVQLLKSRYYYLVVTTQLDVLVLF